MGWDSERIFTNILVVTEESPTWVGERRGTRRGAERRERLGEGVGERERGGREGVCSLQSCEG